MCIRDRFNIEISATSLQDPGLVLQTCQGVLNVVLANLEHEPFMNVEVALRVFYMLGEVITDKVTSLIYTSLDSCYY